MWGLVARRALLAVAVLLASFLGYLLFRNADSVSSNRPIAPESIEQADAKILEFIFRQSKGDVVQWQVQAKQARLFEQDKRAVLRDERAWPSAGWRVGDAALIFERGRAHQIDGARCRGRSQSGEEVSEV